jgi:GNAT superfamily N-acetyltransferase
MGAAQVGEGEDMAGERVSQPGQITFSPATAERWPELEALFGPRGACGCWDMWWRLPHAEFDRLKGEGNKDAFRALVATGVVPGVLAYVGEQPAGWCAIQPRSAYPALERSRALRPVDDQPVWSVTCFFVARAQRRQGLAVQLLRAATAYAVSRGATIVEGYPSIPKSLAMPDVFAWHGTLSTFARAGFAEVARPSASRAIVRYMAQQSA